MSIKLRQIIEKFSQTWQSAIEESISILTKPQEKKYEKYVTPTAGTLNVPPLHWVFLVRYWFVHCRIKKKLEVNLPNITNPDTNPEEIICWIETLKFNTSNKKYHFEWLKDVKETYELQPNSKLPLGWDNMRNQIKHLIKDRQCIEYAKKNLITWDFLRHWGKISKFINENNRDITTRQDLQTIYKNFKITLKIMVLQLTIKDEGEVVEN